MKTELVWPETQINNKRKGTPFFDLIHNGLYLN